MAKGRHAADASGTFYRDLAMMILGILVVGAAVFLLLFVLAGDGTSSVTSTSVAAVETTTTLEPAPTTTSTTIATTTTAAETTTTLIPVRPPEEVRVAVLNSLGIAGIAGRFTQVLADAGYQTLPPDDFDPEQDPSRIWYREGYSLEANELLQFLPGALVEPLPDDELQPGADVVVVLGTGYEE